MVLFLESTLLTHSNSSPFLLFKAWESSSKNKERKSPTNTELTGFNVTSTRVWFWELYDVPAPPLAFDF